mmetsp:Transcript_929/g.3158  ORF Transcript_929/g.3158 Transcript_929/m.3158 type:complete len:327 (-) Transcript_929:109-1089(-)
MMAMMSGSSSFSGGERAAKKPRRSGFSDRDTGQEAEPPPPGGVESTEEEAKIRDFLTTIATSSALPTGPPKAPPPVYFDVVRADTGELLGRLDLSGTPQLTFGRDPSRVDVALEHGSISRHHATMTFDGTDAFVSDFRSTHGTFVTRGGAETRLQERDLVQLHPGDALRFGESSRRYVFRIAATAKESSDASSSEGPKRRPTGTTDEAAPPTTLQDGVVDLGQGRIKLTLQAPSSVVESLLSRDGSATLKAIEKRTSTHLAFDTRPARGPMRFVEIRGKPNSVAAARLELLTIHAAPPPLEQQQQQGAHHRFRYASTAVGPADSLE